VLLRIALQQPNSLPDWRQLRQTISSRIVLLECLRTLDRIRLREQLTATDVAAQRAAMMTAISTVELVEIDAGILQRAAQPIPTELATLDAIHLATALLWQETSNTTLVMATHDRELAVAAVAHGMKVIGISTP
jgi:predicted nucleic acid-binding protein